MSLHRARNFLTRVSQNHHLQTQLEAAAWDSRATVGIGSALGYQFTPADLQSAIDETWGVLTEEELRGVAGGGGRVEVETGTTDDGATSGDTYTPPPGDVSGNSCFFSRTKSR